MGVFLVVGNVLAVISLLLFILCIGLPYWVVIDPGSGANKIYYGIWEICASVMNDDYVCRSFNSAGIHHEVWLLAVGVMLLMGMAFIFLALLAGLCVLCCLRHSPFFYVAAALTALLAGVCGLIGVIVYGAKFSDGNSLDGSDLHASFYLALFAVVFALVATIFYFLAKPKIMKTYH